jgi:hypothetical protein
MSLVKLSMVLVKMDGGERSSNFYQPGLVKV